MRRRWAWAVVTVAMGGLMPAEAAAQGAAPVVTLERNARFQEGLDRFAKGDFEGSRVAFTEAYAVTPDARILWNLALSELRSNHPLEALTHFKKYLKDPAATQTNKDHAPALMKEAAGKTGHITIEAPAGARITVDGAALIDVTPLSDAVDVAPGKHTVVAKVGDATKTATVSCAAGETTSAKLPFDDPRPATTATTGAILPPPGASDTTAPPQPPDQGETTHGPSTAKLATTIVLGAGAVVALGIGIGFQVAASNDSSTVSSLQGDQSSCVGVTSPRCQQLADAADANTRDGNLRTGFLVGGGLLAVAAVATWFLWPKADSSHTSFVPLLSPGTAGLGYTTRF